MDVFDLLTMIGGLCLFLFGMNVMSQALKRRAGGKLNRLLSRMTATRAAGIFSGILVTAIIQSSSATSVLVVSFVNSGLMDLKQACSVIIGANVGATATSWLLSLSGLGSGSLILQLLKPSSFTPVLALIGIGLYMFTKKSKQKDTGLVLLGFATLMYGMEIMASGVEDLSGDTTFHHFFTLFEHPLLGCLVGIVLTMIIQSSAASVGIVQALATAGQITGAAAIPLVMGANIGTCITAILSSVGANNNARRAAAIHLLFNVIGTAVFLAIYWIWMTVSPAAWLSQNVNAVQVALINTVFKVLCMLLFLPFPGLLEKLACKLLPDKAASPDAEEPIQLDERLLATPALALERCDALTADMAKTAIGSMKDAIESIHNWSESLSEKIIRAEERTDREEDALGSYLVKVSAARISERDSREAAMLLKMIGDLERIGDHAVNTLKCGEEMQEKKISFSEEAEAEICTILSAVNEILDLTLHAFLKRDIETAKLVEPLEEVIDELKENLRTNHILRMQRGDCSIEAGFVWSDLVTNLERVSGHCSNVGGCLIDTANHNLDLHRTLRDIRQNSTDYTEKYRFYSKKYALRPLEQETAADNA